LLGETKKQHSLHAFEGTMDLKNLSQAQLAGCEAGCQGASHQPQQVGRRLSIASTVAKGCCAALLCCLTFGFGSSAHADAIFDVAIDIISFADNDGSNQAVSPEFVQDVFDEMNSIQYHPHGIHLSVRNFSTLNHTGHNNLAVDSVGGAKLYADANTPVPREPWVLAAFFTQASWGGGVAWGGGGAAFGISYSDSGGGLSSTELIMSHEVGHNLGLAHLDQYPVGSGMHHSDPGNEDNRMWGGTFFQPWQAEIMTGTNYGQFTSSVDGDVNQDGVLNILDIDAFVLGWRSNTTGLSAVESIKRGDLNLSGETDLRDFAILHAAWNAPMPISLSDLGQGVPEPCSLVLLLACTAGVCVGRRRLSVAAG